MKVAVATSTPVQSSEESTQLQELHLQLDDRIRLHQALAQVKSHPMFSACPESTIQALLHPRSPYRAFEPGEEISRQGDPVDTVLFLISGRAKADLRATSGHTKAIVMDILGLESTIGLISLVDDGPHSATVTAMTQVQALAFSFKSMKTFLAAQPDWYRVLCQISVRRLRNSASWLEALLV